MIFFLWAVSLVVSIVALVALFNFSARVESRDEQIAGALVALRSVVNELHEDFAVFHTRYYKRKRVNNHDTAKIEASNAAN
jgi:uncharacterized membrane protein